MVLLFLDGVGLGEPDEDVNPLAAAATPVLDGLLGARLDRTTPAVDRDGLVFRHLDATLGHDGLPQSATGQTAILTGVNAADVMDGHYGPWPGPTLRRVLDEGSLFTVAQARATGGGALANAFPPGYFQALGCRRYRPNANVYAATKAGLRLRGVAEYRAGAGVPSDLEGAHLGPPAGGGASLGPRGSAAALAGIAAAHLFTMLDIWLTDHFGHRRDFQAGRALIERFDAFLGALLEGQGGAAGDLTLVVTSDHGNLEDLTTTQHTRNPVPLLASGPGAGAFAAARSLLDVAPAARAVLERTGRRPS